MSHRVAFGWGKIGPSLQFTLSWCARPFPRTTPCSARSLLFLSLPLPNLSTPLLPFLSLPLPATPAHLCPATPAHPFLPTRSHYTPHLRSVCCEVLSASRDCGFPGCDGILGIRMTDPQAGRRRWPWLISAISRDGLLWWSGTCRHHFSTSPDFSVRRPPCLCCNLGSSRTHVREGWGQWRTRWSSRRVRWVWGVVAAGVGGQAQHRHSQPRDALRHGRAGSGPPAHSHGT